MAWNYTILACAIALSLYVSYLVRRRRRWSAIIDRIPGPHSVPLLGIAWDLIGVKSEDIMKCMYDMCFPFIGKYPMVRLWAGPFPMILLLRADAVKELLNSNKHLDKSMFYKYLRNWMGESIVTSTGSRWQQRRRLITPSFHFQILDNFLPVMTQQADILVQLLDTNCKRIKREEFNIYPFITRCTLDIICETAMGQSLNCQLNPNSEYFNAVNGLNEVIVQRFLKPWLGIDWIFRLSSAGKLEKKCLKIVHGLSNKVIKMKRDKLAQSKTGNTIELSEESILGKKRRVILLDMLLEHSSEDSDQILTNEDIREEVDTFMIGGHDTTSAGITWTLYYVGHHPDVQQKVVDEINNVFGADDEDVTSDHLHNLKYLECVIKESLRLLPPLPDFGRTITEDTTICGYDIPAGVTVNVSTLNVHRDPAHFPDPETFDPDRFLPENSRNRDPFAYIPFSAGPRNCIGQRFAMMELKVILSRILRHFHVETKYDPDLLFKLTGGMVLKSRHGLPIRLTPRQS